MSLTASNWTGRAAMRVSALLVSAIALAGNSHLLSASETGDSPEAKPAATQTAGVNDPQTTEQVSDELQIDDFDRDHWAYQPRTNPPIPDVDNSDWARTTIDQFVLAKLHSESLSPVGPADRPTLIRRLSFDLIGMPPTPAELSQFLGDDRPGSYRRLVERLLASPQYGRRWGQHWLDLARFAETDGYEHDKVRPNAWRYRDWVIDVLNQDMGYDQFITSQVAGDIPSPNEPPRQSPQIATAFVLSGPDMPDINSQQERKHVLMNEMTSTIGATLLSLQIGCSQCHDHKYDAISQGDFYRLRAFFDRGVKLKTNQSVHVLSANADPDAISQIHPRGAWQLPGPPVVAAFPRIANPLETEVTTETHPRVQLAKWLTDPSQPLTARSIVNRVWQYHFGTGLSNTPSDFGVMGEEPSHPKLLDHLASRLINHRWSLKDLHRQIVLSATYRTQSKPPVTSGGNAKPLQVWQDAKQSDPANRLLARFPRRRLDAESIRDAILVACGALNHESGGPGVSPPLPQELVATLKSGQWKTSSQISDHHRRSIYIFARRNLRYPLFATFDRPAANCSCAIRVPSTTAIQSLLLMNSSITMDASERLASLCFNRHPVDQSSQTQEVYQRILSRNPDKQEQIDCLQFLSNQAKLLEQEKEPQPALAALTDLCRAMFNCNEFLYVD